MEESTGPVFILHWNDAYQIESQEKEEPIGGASRFVAKCNEIKKQCDKPVMVCCVLYQPFFNAQMTCAGDLFNPSMLSVVHKGKQMLPLIKALGISIRAPLILKLTYRCQLRYCGQSRLRLWHACVGQPPAKDVDAVDPLQPARQAQRQASRWMPPGGMALLLFFFICCTTTLNIVYY
jgi:hypothetical protein